MTQWNVYTKEPRFPVARDLYGLFFEDINRSGDGGIYPEMLRNRAFEDSLVPEDTLLNEADVWGVTHLYPKDLKPDSLDCEPVTFVNAGGWRDTFNNGEGMKKWLRDVPKTPIPAWYADKCEMTLSREDTLNPNRKCALKVCFAEGGSLCNIGFNGISLRKGKKYTLLSFLKGKGDITLRVKTQEGCPATNEIRVTLQGEYTRLDAEFEAICDCDRAWFEIRSDAAELTLGYVSLMPHIEDTYKGHGLRRDICEMLEGMHPRFMRFPGGCIVEGMSKHSATRFTRTIGPVWERPSQQLMWHYRATNGLGFHEYMQLCEDMDVEPMYVFNCGMTCQPRNGEVFEGDELQEFVDEALAAMEYALGDVTTKYGALRAAAGHPEPFKMTYLEIGNENSGPAYNERYQMFYDILSEKYPEVVLISNTHTERFGLPTQVADEHYYSTPMYFAERTRYFDAYDRNGPQIFIGEFEAANGPEVASTYAAMTELAYMLGVENNQDIVTLLAYAPMLQNVDYTTWMPNLIAFDQTRIYGIPTYHGMAMLAGNRGKEVLTHEVETRKMYRYLAGVPGINLGKPGMKFRNATFNGRSLAVDKVLLGELEQEGDQFISVKSDKMPENRMMRRIPQLQEMTGLIFGGEEADTGVFEIEVWMRPEDDVTLTLWNHKSPDLFSIDEPKERDATFMNLDRQCWSIGGGESKCQSGFGFRAADLCEPVKAEPRYHAFNRLRVEMKQNSFECYLNGVKLHEAELTSYPMITGAASATQEEVILKCVNLSDAEQEIGIHLDCDVEAIGKATVLTGKRHARNTLEHPETVAPVDVTIEDAGKDFSYRAPAYSLNVIVLKKQQ